MVVCGFTHPCSNSRAFIVGFHAFCFLMVTHKTKQKTVVNLSHSCTTSFLLSYVTSVFRLFCLSTHFISLFRTWMSSDETIMWLTAADLKFSVWIIISIGVRRLLYVCPQ